MITLFDNWVILVDEKNYTLAKYLGDIRRRDGRIEKNLKIYGYYSVLSEALNALRVCLIRKCLSDGCRTLSEALRTITEENDRIEKLFKGIEVN